MKIINSGRGIHQREIPGLEKLKSLPDHWHAFTNLDLALPGRGVREIDLIMVIEDRLLLVDLKDWVGPVRSEEGSWFNGKRDCGRSPVHKIAENVRELTPLLRKFLTEQEKREQGINRKLTIPWIEGVVVLTRAHDRSGISGSEVSRVFSIDPFMRMLKNRAERDTQLCIAPSRHVDFTAPDWITRLRRFFNTSTGIFQIGVRRYGGFRARNDSPTFIHREGIFTEFEVDEEGVEMSSGLLRRWDFTKAETRFQTEEGRFSIVGREKTIVAWLDDRNPACGSMLFRPKIDDKDRGVAYWEIFERRRRIKRLSDFNTADFHHTTPNQRIELARQVLAAMQPLHELQVAHQDIGAHSIWLELPTTVRLSHLMAASFPEIATLGEARYQFLSSSTVPEDVLGGPTEPLRRDVFLLGCAIHTLLFGVPPKGEPPEWDPDVDAENAFTPLHQWFERSLDIDLHQRYGHASELLDAFNEALSQVPDARTVIEGLDRFRTLKSQRQVFQTYPESELLQEDDRVAIWRTDGPSCQRIVKLWKGTAIGDVAKEAPRILAFLERAQAVIESPIPGAVRLRNVHWTGDAIVIVQDFVSGPTLADEALEKSHFPSSEELLQFFRRLVDVVDVLHDRSISHGDLKPENIIVSTCSDTGSSFPVLVDILDFGPSRDGERITRAYAPSSGGRFERDRFAVTRLVEERLSVEKMPRQAWSDIVLAIDKCRVGPPANATLLPLRDALDRTIAPPIETEPTVGLKVFHTSALVGPIHSDEGQYWISRFGPQLNIRGAVEQLEIRLDSEGNPASCRRVSLTQNAIQRMKRYEFASVCGELAIENGINDLSAIANILERSDIVEAWARFNNVEKVDSREDFEQDVISSEMQEDELAEKLSEISLDDESTDIRRLWRRLMDLEAELTTEATCLGDSTFRRDSLRHVVPVQMLIGELDFDRDDTVTVERQDAKGRWTRIGFLDTSTSTPGFIAIESWMGVSRSTLVVDGTRLRFQSRYENTSRERRDAAVSRILQGSSAAPRLIDVFQPSIAVQPNFVPIEFNEEEVAERYGLNSVQVAALRGILECRPVGLLQGPPGTGKTRFIGALVHYALTHGLARNVLLASQSHEAVNNAAEAVLKLFGVDRDSLSLIRVGHEGSVSDTLRQYHVARVESSYKEQFRATLKQRLTVIARAVGLEQLVSERVIHFESVIRPVLSRISELAGESEVDIPRLHSLVTTAEQLLASQGIEVDLSDTDADVVEDEVCSQFLSSLPREQAASIEKLRLVAELSRDIVGSVSTWQRSFETFLAGTRQVVAGTCVGLGRTSLGLTKTAFDLVIVDEAARCTSSELAVPIQAGKWVVLVGDQAQLEPLHPPLVVQSVANELGISLRDVARSDFERVFESSYGKAAGFTLTTQYRMLPPIGRLVSGAFYDRSLAHGRRQAEIDESAMPPELLKPLVWISTDSLGQNAYQKPDKVRRGSLTNPVEANVIVTLLKKWSEHEPFLVWLASRPLQERTIGVICAYAAQRDLVWKKVQAENLPDIVRRALKVDTIDSYQGKENPIVLLSLVRHNADGSAESGTATIAPGFMVRKNRVNVALSRAMDRLIIIGAQTRWHRGTPLSKIVTGFFEEVESDEAVTIDAHQLFEVVPDANLATREMTHNAAERAEQKVSK